MANKQFFNVSFMCHSCCVSTATEDFGPKLRVSFLMSRVPEIFKWFQRPWQVPATETGCPLETGCSYREGKWYLLWRVRHFLLPLEPSHLYLRPLYIYEFALNSDNGGKFHEYCCYLLFLFWTFHSLVVWFLNAFMVANFCFYVPDFFPILLSGAVRSVRVVRVLC